MSRATSVPMWSNTVSPRGGSSHPNMAGTMTRWPLEETGRNSVSPWMRPSTISCTSHRSEPYRTAPVTSAGSLQRPDSFSALAGPLVGDRPDHVEEKPADPVEIRLEEREHLGLGDRLDARLPL